ncbi:MAG: CHAT domain-containing protein [Myxococcales bacterium]|nr:CHAT domain-containing protein [Myxococcales bacterium]
MSSSSPIHIELELVRAKESEDAFAFRFSRQAYLVRGRQGAYETVELPWSRELLRDLEECRRPDRDPDVVARVGELLRELLTPAGWSGHEATIVEARAAHRRVIVTLRSAAAELYALPWELLTLRADGQHLGALEHVLLRYAWPGTSTVSADPRAIDGPGRLLVAWSAAGGGVPAAEQLAAIREASGEAPREEGAGELEVLEHASYGALADALEAAESAGRPFRALHLLCHGAEARSTFGLSLDAEDGAGRAVVVDAGRLQQLLAPHARDLRLVVVAACDGGNMGEPGNRIGSVAQRLHRAGLQHVVASRYPLSARGSTRIARALYGNLWRGESIEQAFVAARSAAAREVTRLDWASLQLYARPEDGDEHCVLVPMPPPTLPAPALEPIELAARVARPDPARPFPWLVAVLVLAVVGGLGAYLLMESEIEAPSPAPVARAEDPARVEASATPAERTTGDVAEPAATTGEPAVGDESTGGASTGPERSASGSASPTPALRSEAGSTSSRAKPARTRPSSSCSDELREYLRDRLPGPLSGRYRVRLVVGDDGKVTLDECDRCGEAAEEARTGLSRIRSARITSGWGSELPCKTSFEWQ